MIWAVFAIMTGAVVLTVLWPLGRARKTLAREPDVRFYEAQVEEIDRDLSLGLLTPADAASAKAEAGRRLLSVAEGPVPETRSRWGVRFAAISALVVIPAVTLAVYAVLGNPELPDQPLSARVAEREGQRELLAAIQKIETHLAGNPDDGRGWDVIAPVYMRMGRYDEAARAYGNANRVLGDSIERLTAQGEALVYAAREQVTPQAREVFQKVLDKQPGHPVAFFYLAMAREQDGDRAGALDAYSRLAIGTPPDAPWQSTVRARIVALGGTPPQANATPQGEAAEAIRAMPAGEQQAMIRGMVDSLAARLDADGRDVEGWLRLLRSYTALREPDLARAALAKARTALAGDADGLRRINALAEELGLKG